MRCDHCPLKHLPVCAGEDAPDLCGKGGKTLVDRSKYLSSLAGYPAPPPPPPQEVPPRSSREVVVAKYREDVSWLAGVAMHAVIYDKCPAVRPRRALPARVTSVPRQNVGREAETMLNHIITRYDDLAEVTFFVQGDPFEHSPDLLERLECAYAEPTSLSLRYRAGFPAAEVTALDRVSRHCGREIRLGVADGYERVFGVGHPFHGYGSTHTAAWLDEVWDRVFACRRPDPLYFGYAAQWAVPAAAVTRRSRECWRAVRDLVLGDALSPWACEVLWLSLFADPATYPDRWTPRRRPRTEPRPPCNCGRRP